MTYNPKSTNKHYEAGYAEGFDDARNGQALPVTTRSPYWDGYQAGVTDARGHYS